MTKRTLSDIAKNPRRGIGRFLVFSQIAAQLGLAIVPFNIHSVHAESQPLKWYQSGNLTPQEQEAYQQQSARMATAASILAQDDSTRAAENLARSAVTGALNNEVSSWLNQFGTARIQLNLDDKYQLSGSQADVLLPLYESDSNLLFSQLGLRRLDQRTTGNLGVGARTFTGDWMFGINSFLDNDFSGNNQRFGVGVEAWRDYLKLSANSYFRLSDWRQSRDFADYQERPANGWDIRAEGWLPSMPQLGAKLMMEQYKGDEVALFGKDNRQKNPWALTAGVSYTPVPLVTLAADHRVGMNGQQDSQINLALSYRMGEPWHKQINPSAVADTRLLSSSRHDLVERNNSIVLDYRRQQLLTLGLPATASGKSRSQLPLSFVVENTHAIQRISWDSPALIAAGGSIAPAGEGRINITLPVWLITGNNYTLTGTVYDVEGNSHSATTTIVVEMADIDAGASSVNAAPPSIIADGASTSTVTVTLVDGNNQPVTDMAPALKMALQETQQKEQHEAQRALKLQQSAIGEVKESAAGVYEAIVTSGTRAGSVQVTPSVNGVGLKTATIQLTADDSTSSISEGSVTRDKESEVADDVKSIIYTALVKDRNGNPVPDVTVSWSHDLGTLSAAASNTNANGQATVSLRSAEAGKAIVSAAVGSATAIKAAAVDFIADSSTPVINQGDVTRNKSSALANDNDIITFTATVKDAKGNPLQNVKVNWSTDFGALGATASNTNGSGQATVTLKSHTAGEATVKAALDNAPQISADKVTFTADDSTGSIDEGAVTRNKASEIADDVQTITFTAVVKDLEGNPVPYVAVNWATTLGNLSENATSTNINGQASVNLSSERVGTAVVSATYRNRPPINAEAVSFIADNSSAEITGDVTADKTSEIADNAKVITFTALVKDASGHPIQNATVKWTTSFGSLNASSTNTNASGQAIVTLKSASIGSAIVKAQLGEGEKVEADAVSFTADSGSAEITGDVTSDKTSEIADNNKVITFTATVQDDNQHPVAGATVKWTTSFGTLNVASSNTNASGQAIVTLKSADIGSAIVKAQLGEGEKVEADAVSFTADSSSAEITGDVTSDKTSEIADNTKVITFTALVKDASGHPIQNATVKWTTSFGSLNASSTNTNASGQAIVTLKSSSIGSAIVKAQLGEGEKVEADAVSFTADSSSAEITGDVTSDKTSEIADNNKVITFTATVQDDNQHPVAGATVKWTTSFGTLNVASSTTNASGQAIVTLKSADIGSAIVKAQLGEGEKVEADAVSFTADSGSAEITGDVTSDKTSEIADNTKVITFTATVQDDNDHPVAGATVKWTTTLGSLNVASSTTNASGQAIVTLKSASIGSAIVKAQLGEGEKVEADAVSFTADNGSAEITGDVTSDKTSEIADNVKVITFTAMVKDDNDHPVSGATVKWTTTLGTLNVASSNTNASGQAIVTLKSASAGSAIVKAQLGDAAQVAADAVSFTADPSTAEISDLKVDVTSVAANNLDVATYTATVRDANDNLLKGMKVTWSTTFGTLGTASEATDDNGEAQITLKSANLGSAIVSATLENKETASAQAVNFVVDMATLSVSLSSNFGKVIGTGVHQPYITARVVDASGYPLVGSALNWTTSNAKSRLSYTSNVTDANGEVTIRISALLHDSSVNESTDLTATVPGTTKTGTKDITLYPVMLIGNKYYWTLSTVWSTDVESTATIACSGYGGGRILTRQDIADFAAGNGNFANMSVQGEYKSGLYPITREFEINSAVMHSANGTIGEIRAYPIDQGSWRYVCVRDKS